MKKLLVSIWKSRYVYLFLLPVLVIIAIFGYFPAIQAFSLSILNERGEFTGITNFAVFFTDRVLGKSTINLLKLLIAGMITGNIPSFVMAEILFNMKSKKISNAYRYLFIIPMMIPGIVIMLVWQYLMFDPLNGIANAVIKSLGGEPLGWLGEVKTALPSLMLVGFPWMAGTNLLIYLAGIQGISDSVIESATLDGASIWRRIFTIDLPLILGQIKLLVILGFINGIQAFGLQLMTTNGDPAYSTMVPGLWMYRRAFRFSDFEYASTIGVMMFLVIFILSYLNNKYIKSDMT
ncbi:MAG: sugar ABC transporter permease [Treponema sp.]|jgi:ABC-type sugar transport system permease subunit|nr:sugar ABC transporter permease [Treponema sp.]